LFCSSSLRSDFFKRLHVFRIFTRRPRPQAPIVAWPPVEVVSPPPLPDKSFYSGFDFRFSHMVSELRARGNSTQSWTTQCLTWCERASVDWDRIVNCSTLHTTCHRWRY
jgi:hypothetical protein